MKKIIYFGLSLLLSAAAVSCSMDFEPTGAYSDKTFWYSAKNAESGLTGCYLPLRNGSMFGGMAIVMEECATPNAYNYANTLNWNDLAKGSHTADGSIFAGRWKDAYTGIGRCNMLLQHIGLNKELSAEAVTQMKAQARFPPRPLLFGADDLLLQGAADRRFSRHLAGRTHAHRPGGDDPLHRR